MKKLILTLMVATALTACDKKDATNALPPPIKQL